MLKLALLLACLCLGVHSSPSGGSHETGVGSAPGRKPTTCPCGMSKKGRVVGGTKALPNEFPWMVSLVTAKENNHVCGAAIITEWYGITAAHCTASGVPMSIRTATSDITKKGLIVPLKGYTPHNFDSGRVFNDISLLVFAWPIKFSATVSPICLPTGRLNLENQWVKVLGWGMLGDKRPGSTDLQEADVQVYPFQACRSRWTLSDSHTQMCIKSVGRGLCFGDSGGPIVWLDPETNRYTLVGLVSFGSANCDTNVPQVLTDVSAFVPWIRTVMSHPGCHKA